MVIATPTNNRPGAAQRAGMEKSGRHRCGRVKIYDRHGHYRLVGCSIAELTVLIASPTANGSICQTRAGKIQPNGNLPSRTDVGHLHCSSIILCELAIPQPTIAIVSPTTDRAITENSTGMAPSRCDGQYRRRFRAVDKGERHQYDERCEDRRKRDRLNSLKHSVLFQFSSRTDHPASHVYARISTWI